MLTEKEKTKLSCKEKVPKEVYKYIRGLMEKIYIDPNRSKYCKASKLLRKMELNGWCFQTTDTCILLFPDDAYIVRGNLLWENDQFDLSISSNNVVRLFHSWIVFKYNGVEYVFDPSSKIINSKQTYDSIFECEELGRTTARDAKDFFINNFTLGALVGDNNINSPMYRNNTQYDAHIEDGEIVELKAKYFHNKQ